MTDQIKCENDRRKEITLKSELNGIDYVEVVSSKKKDETGFDSLIFVHCIKELEKATDENNIAIVGGSRIKNIKVHWAKRADQVIDENLQRMTENEKKMLNDINLQDKKKTILVRTDRGDFSTYLLYLTSSQKQIEIPLDNFDERLSRIDFVYSSDCNADFDCNSEEQCFPEILEEYDIDYMAKDYASFRQNILDRLSLIMPKWKERNPADMGITLVELLAYIADNLSYYQDAVANEAYLGTARKRISVKRHTRLLNYFLGEGHNARAWICLQVNDDGNNTVIPRNTKILAGINNKNDSKNLAISEFKPEEINNEIIFETMYDITLRKSSNEIHFHTWSNPECCLPKGATSATLQNKDNILYGNMLFSWNKLQKTDRETDENLKPDDISESEKNSILAFLNSVESAKDIVNAIEFPQEIDVGARIAKRIIKERKDKGYFQTLSEIYDIPFIGPERFTEIVLALRAHLSQEEREKLFAFLKRSLGTSWIDNASILRNDAKKEFVISDWNNNNKIIIHFDENSGTATLEHNERKSYEFHMKKNNDNDYDVYALNILRGDVLVFEEIRSPTTRKPEDADKTHRQAVRITKAVPLVDRVESIPVVEIHWDIDDALSFPLCIYNYEDPKTSSDKELPISVAFGNVVLADHGFTITQTIRKDEKLKDHQYYSEHEKGIVASQSLGIPFMKERFYPRLSDGPLTFSGDSFDASKIEPLKGFSTASSLFDFDERDILPEIEIYGEGYLWKPKKDLLSSGQFDTNFVVEIDDNGIASIRFGDDEHGRKPIALEKDDDNNLDGNLEFYTKFRVGNGQVGNVGANSLGMIVSDNKGITSIRNPMTARGGADPEPIMRAQQMAPNSFQKQQRAVTENDYTEILEKHPDIQKAKATIRWTGSWHTVFVTIDRFGGLDVDESFKEKILAYLEKYRLAGYDLEVVHPSYLPINIILRIYVLPDQYRESVRERLLEEFSNRKLSSKKNGFFHPDNFTFGQSLFLSQLYKAALDVDGVASVEILEFKRWGKEPRQEIQDGFIKSGISEIIRADNDPTFPDNGKIDFEMCGGL